MSYENLNVCVSEGLILGEPSVSLHNENGKVTVSQSAFRGTPLVVSREIVK
jgi:hypothetical protein